MKKSFIVTMLSLALPVLAGAQPRAIGLRMGGDMEVSYQHSVGRHFLEADLGLVNYKGGEATAVFDFVIASPGDFNIYLGPGAQLGFYDYSRSRTVKFGVGLAAQLGAEYQFPSIPLNISLDYRPAYNFIEMRGCWYSVSLGVRYRF